MSKLYHVISKNFKLLLRSKGSALIILFGPLFLILLIGAAFNTSNVYGIKVGIYADKYTPLGESLVQELTGKQFNVMKISSKDLCLEQLKAGDLHICSIFPADLSIDKESKIIFYVDPSRINLVYLVIEGISSKVATKSEEISLQLTKGLLEVLTTTKTNIEKTQTYPAQITQTSQQGNTYLQQAAATLKEQDFAFKEQDFDLDELQRITEELATTKNVSLTAILGPIGRMKQLVREKVTLMKKNAGLRDTTGKTLTEVQQTLARQEELAAELQEELDIIQAKINSVAMTSAGKIVSPISTSIEPVVAKKNHLNYLFPTLLMMIILFMGILLSAILIIREKTGISYFRNFISPTNETLFILGNYLTNVIIIFLQLFIVCGVAFYFFGKTLLSLLPQLALILLIFTTLFIFIGMILGYLFKSEETSILAAISISSLCLFFSNTILPLETLPGFIKHLTNYNPFVLGENILRKIMIFQTGLPALNDSIYIALGMVGISFIFVIITNMINKRTMQA
ncbi:MAG: ABC transporter permease [Nanoarchaeota archaeon]|nr:ABC transporter permease [Nanoarchaeota archaeon]